MTAAQPTRTTHRPALLGAIVAAVAVIVGSFGTWISVMMFDVDGTDLDWWGITALVLAIVSAVILLALLYWDRTPPEQKPFPQRGAVTLAWVVTVAAVACFTDALIMIIRVLKIPDDAMFGMSFTIGWGLWLVAIASVVLAILGGMSATSLATGLVDDQGRPWGRSHRLAVIVISVVIVVVGVVYAFARPFTGGDIAEDFVTEVSGG